MIIFNKLIFWFGSNIFKIILFTILLFFLFFIFIISIPIVEFFNFFFNSFNEFQGLMNNIENFLKEFNWEKMEIKKDEIKDTQTL
mgnify:CR=1 FL=1|tara:strand:- start:60 stop:314 length:255 start_codon:yes stop_codon:yes gene_type:complete